MMRNIITKENSILPLCPFSLTQKNEKIKATEILLEILRNVPVEHPNLQTLLPEETSDS